MSTGIAEYCEQEKKLFTQRLYEESSVIKERVGTIRRLDDGRAFVYSRAGAVALAAGKLNQVAAPQANHLNKTIAAAAAIGDKSVTVNVVTTALTADMYANGYIHINDATGEAYAYKIRTHPAAAAGATCVLQLYDAVRVALVATTSEYTLIKNPADSVIVFPTTQTGAPAGVAPIAVTALYYFWQQIKGPCAVLTDTTVVIGNDVIPSTNVAGAVMPGGTADIVGAVGRVLSVNADTEYSLIALDIPGY